MDVTRLKEALRLYAITDPALLANRSLTQCVSEAISGGASAIQVRDKAASAAEIERCVRSLVPLCADAKVILIVNDAVDAAKAAGADGVHIGQDDISCTRARSILGPDAVIGVSVQNVAQARMAQDAGASYLGVGAMYPTPTKPEAADVSYEELVAIREAVSIPLVVIGGINIRTIPDFSSDITDGFAVVSAVFAHEDITEATRAVKNAIDEALGYASGHTKTQRKERP